MEGIISNQQYNLNTYNCICQLYLNKGGEKKIVIKKI